ncbi:MAG: HAMP domain-containing histidine kinase [Phycisphaerae bacterium]|nr:HAMP domain-containing histidine kinase [Phycisphaerae bacterium]
MIANHKIDDPLVDDQRELAELKRRLVAAEQMAAVGRMSARVAHELNNPLDGILRYVNLAIRAIEIDHTERLPDYLAHARDGLFRMREIARELVAFSRTAYNPCNDSSIQAAIDEAVQIMSSQAHTLGVSILCRLSADMPLASQANLFQVFCNLIKNAIDAMPTGGTLTIRTDVVDSQLTITFEDTGIGLPEPTDRIFEPFFTTKSTGKGTGLGLAICKDLIEKLGGQIWADRCRPNGGSIFTIQLPLTMDLPNTNTIATSLNSTATTIEETDTQGGQP